MPVAEAALAYVGSKVLDYVAGEAINAAGTASVSGLRTKLGRDPARLACQLALARAEARFASAYPQWHSAFFDQSFLATRAAPLLARALTRSDTATAAELAEAWCLELGGRTGERYREQIEPAAAEFLGWWRGELGRFEVFRPVLDSRALDSTAASTHATADEVRVLRAQLTDALGQLDRAVVRARYPALSDFLDWPSRDMVRRTRGIVGREWVFEELSHFAQRRCGYVHLIADAGLGKTELAVAIARRHDAPAFFFTASDRRTRPERCLDHLSVELIDRHGLAHDRLPEHSGEDSGFLSQLLSEIDSTQRPVWLVIDALDEADAHGAGNLVGLPAELPPNVFVVLSHRPGDYTLNVRPGIAQDELHLRADDPRHARDVTQYLHQRANEQAVAEGLARARPPVQPGEFARVLAVASEGNFMYLDYLLADLVDETTPTLDATRLPRGLTGYYREMWQTIRQDAERDSEQWDWLHLPLLEHLAVAGEPVSPAWLGNHLVAPEKSVRRVLRHWQRFLHQTPHERWRIIHQSFRDYLAETDEVELGAAHRAIAEYYLADDERRSVHEGYALRHLSRHLRHAGESDRLFLLVEDAGWQELQDLHDPSWSNYLTDVGQAWATAAELDAHALARRQRPRWLLQETLQAIATAELHSASALIPTKLLHRLLEAGAWTAQHGLLVASRNPDAASRVEALAVVVSHLPAEQRNRTLTGALADAASVADPDVQAHVLGSLGPHLSASLFADAFAQAASIPKPAARATALARLAPYLPERLLSDALAAATAIVNPKARAVALGALAPRLPERLLPGALAAATAITNSDRRAQALAGLAPHLPENLLADALSATLAIPNRGARVVALSALAPRLPEHLLPGAVPDALAATATITNPNARARALSWLAPHLPESVTAEPLAGALAAVNAMTDPGARAHALGQLAPHLPQQLRRSALNDALADGDPQSRVLALAALAPSLPDHPLLPAALRDGLGATAKVANPNARARILEALAPHLSEDLLDDALAAALGLTDPRARDRAFAGATEIDSDSYSRFTTLLTFSAHLPLELRGDAVTRALSAAMSITDSQTHALALEMIARHLPADLVPDALAAAGAIIDDDQARARALAALAGQLTEYRLRETLQGTGIWVSGDFVIAAAPYLPEHLLPDALAATARIADERTQARSVVALAPRLPASLLPEALTVATTISRPGPRVHALVALAPLLPEHLPPDAVAALAPHISDRECADWLAAATALPQGHDRVVALSSLAPYLPEQLLAETLSTASSLPNPDVRALVLAALAAHLPPGLLHPAFDAAVSISDSKASTRAVSALVPRLPPGYLSRAVRDELLISDPWQRGRTLAALAPHLSEELFPDALAAAINIADPHARADALSALAPHLPERLLPHAFTAAVTIDDRDDDAIHGQPEAQAVAIAGVAVCLPTQFVPDAIERAIDADVLDELIPHLPDDFLRDALAATSSITDPFFLALALEALTPRLPQDLLPDAFVAAISIAESSSRALALDALASRIPTLLLADALATEARADTLPAIASELRALPQAIVAASSITDPQIRNHVLNTLEPRLSRSHLPDAVSAATAITDPAARAAAIGVLAPLITNADSVETLAVLAPHLPEDLLPEALAAAINVGDPNQRAHALTVLAPRLSDSLFPQALAAATGIAGSKARAHVLAGLAPYLPESLLPEALAAVTRITVPRARAHVLSSLAPRLPETLFAPALAVANGITDPQARAQALAALAARLPEELLADPLAAALAAASTIVDPGARARALGALIPYLPHHVVRDTFADALAAAHAVSDPGARAHSLAALSAVSSQLSSWSARETHELWSALLHDAASGGAPRLSAVADVLAPLLTNMSTSH